jgi:alkanesulfonate monooxygenase SsuD/methylene tetrahydromethanopterin reductase-like flavin-dependent oxidoreductase (luciferase family)
MERVSFEGEFHQVHEIELDVVHGRREPRNVPIYIGATGGKMIEMTGRIADGIVMNYCVPVEYNDMAIEELEKGLKISGRKLEDFDRPQLIVCSVDEDHDVAIDSTRELLTQYLAQQPHIAKASGVSMDVVEKIQAILGWPATHEQIQAAKHLVPEDLIHRASQPAAHHLKQNRRSGIHRSRLHHSDSVRRRRQHQAADRYFRCRGMMQQLPSSRSCYVCGRENPVSLRMTFFLQDNGEVTSEVVVPEEYAGYPGMVHGGNIVAMMDEAAAGLQRRMIQTALR